MQLWATAINDIYRVSYITNIHFVWVSTFWWVRRCPSRHFYVLKIFPQVKREVGDVSILVNNAGMVTGKYTFIEAPDNLVDRTLRVNVAAHFWVRKSHSVLHSVHSLYLCFYVMGTVSLLLSQKHPDICIHRLTRHFSQLWCNETMGIWSVWHAMEGCLLWTALQVHL